MILKLGMGHHMTKMATKLRPMLILTTFTARSNSVSPYDSIVEKCVYNIHMKR